MKSLIMTLLLGALLCGMMSQQAFAQAPVPPGGFDPFDDGDDFEGPPPGANGAPGTPGARPKTFGESATNPPAPPPANGPSDSGSSKGFKTQSAADAVRRKNRRETPNLLSKRPANMNEASDKDITDENFPDLIDSFDYPNAEITDIVKAISELTGKNFIVDPQVRGKITIIAPTRITVAEAYKAFLSALAINSLTVVPSGKFLKVKQAQNAQRDNLDTYSGNYSPNTDAMITRIVQLRYISSKEVFNSLGPILQSRLGEMRPYEPTNTLIISDYGSNIERIMKILRQLDVPGFEEQLAVIRVRYARASELAKLVDQIINKGKNTSQGQGGFTAGIPRFTPLGGAQSTSSEAFSLVIPDDRTNSLVVVGNNSGLEKIKKLVARLDFKLSPEDSGGVYVYYVRYGDAEKMATTLSGLAQASAQSNTAPPPNNGFPGGIANPIAQKAPIFGGDVKITSDKITNSLVVTASKQDYEVVRNILSKLDIPRDQVYVEGILMELSVNNQHQWGLSYYNLIGNNFAGRQGFNSGTIPLSQFLDPSADVGAVLGFGGGGSVTVSPPGPNGTAGPPVTIPSLIGFINFLATNNSVNILSTPQIMALDNEEAEIEVGDQVPVSTQSNSTAVGTTISSQREDVTIKLNIKPHISPGSNNMRLEINEQVRNLETVPIEAAQLGQNNVAISKRNAKTNVMVRDGDTIVLGGLMKDQDSTNVTKIPLLGDIPIIGWLFKGKKTVVKKQNLLMFLTPRIIRSKLDVTTLLERKVKERIQFIEKNVSGKDTQGQYLDSLKIHKTNNQGEDIK